MESLYQGWKTGDAEQRERLLDHPWLYLRAEAESREVVPVPEPVPEEGVRLEGMVEALVSLLRKTRQWIRRGAFRRASPEQRRSTRLTWGELERTVTEVHTLLEEDEPCSITTPERPS